MKSILSLLLEVSLALSDAPALARERGAAILESVEYAALSGGRVRVILGFSEPRAEPHSLVIHRPARIALDFPDTRIRLRTRTRRVSVGLVQRVIAVQARDRTRVVLQLTKLARHEVKVRGRFVYVTVGVLDGRVGRITNVEFRPIESGGGRVVVEQSPPASFVETRREAGRIIVDFIGARLPAHLNRRLDVGDFGTPIKEIDTFPRGKDVRMIVITRGPSQHLAYQATGRLALVVSP